MKGTISVDGLGRDHFVRKPEHELRILVRRGKKETFRPPSSFSTFKMNSPFPLQAALLLLPLVRLIISLSPAPLTPNLMEFRHSPSFMSDELNLLFSP